MIAKASQTRSIADSFAYARAVDEPEKGGEIIRSNVLHYRMDFETQLALLESLSSPKYEVKGITVILSHSPEDTKIIFEKPGKEKKYIGDFLSELKRQGVDLDNVPWVLTTHRNTDCRHYHMLILTTKFDGSRLNTGHIGKKAAKAAYLASRKNNLHFAEGMKIREAKYHEYLAKSEDQVMETSQDPNNDIKGKIVTGNAILQQIARNNEQYEEKKRRQQAAEERRQRLEKIRAEVESCAARCRTMADLANLLAKKGYELKFEKKWYLYYQNSQGKMVKSSLDKGLKLNMEIIQPLERNELFDKAKTMAHKLAPKTNEKVRITAAHLFLGEIQEACRFAKACGLSLSLPSDWKPVVQAGNEHALMTTCLSIAANAFSVIISMGDSGNINISAGGNSTGKRKKSKEELEEEAKSKGWGR